MRASDYRKKVRQQRRAKFMRNRKSMLNVYAQDLMGWEPNDRGIRCPECRPTASHMVNPHCHLCGGAGETDINVARGHILGEE
jgi:RecJ-like exonuclease